MKAVKKHSPEGCLSPLLTFLIYLAAMILLFSCAVQKPVVKQFTVTKIYDGFFAAKNGKTVLLFGTQDSVFVGKVINVSIGKKLRND